jgi:hypothetical protein
VVSPSQAGYLDADHGPFLCNRCVFFVPDDGESEIGTCEKVSGPIDEDGCCNLFQSDGSPWTLPEPVEDAADDEGDDDAEAG